MKEIINEEFTDLSIILESVSEFFRIEKTEVFNKSRKDKILLSRQWFHYLSRKLNPKFELSSRQIGLFYKDVTGISYDHATVLNSFKSISNNVFCYKKDRDIERKLLDMIKAKKIDLIPCIDKVTYIYYCLSGDCIVLDENKDSLQSVMDVFTESDRKRIILGKLHDKAKFFYIKGEDWEKELSKEEFKTITNI